MLRHLVALEGLLGEAGVPVVLIALSPRRAEDDLFPGVEYPTDIMFLPGFLH